MTDFKLVVVGDGCVGKSCLLIASQTGSFPGEYIPTVFDNYSHDILVDSRPYHVSLWDTAGQEDYDRLRPLSYPATDAFLLCFDVANRNSFINIEQKWLPEVKHYAPDSAYILVATKIDLRSSTDNVNNRTPGARGCVTYREGKELAERLGISTYIECSALTHQGIETVIPTAVRTAVLAENGKKETRFSFLGKMITSRKKSNSEPQPPALPPAGLAPWISVITSTFAEDWRSVLTSQDSSCSDVKFLIANKPAIHAHNIVLASSSVIFKEILLSPKKSNQVPKKYAELFEEIKWIHNNQSRSGMNNLNLPPSGNDSLKDNECVEITLNQRINHDVFIKILEFLYSGLPGFSEIEDTDFVQEVQHEAELFHLDWLRQVCENRLKDEMFLNPSIGTWLNDDVGSNMKRLFLNKPQMSDVQFRVEGQLVYAHKAVLTARCDVMAAMLGGAFMEGRDSKETTIRDANLESFLAVLEYLYTDHAPIEEGDAVEIMVLADRFCLPRLVTLCELYITKKVDKMIEKKVGDGTEFVVNLLLLSQAHNAQQLSNWCLHFIATNYSVFESSPFFSLLQGTNREYLEEHRWPPLSYFKELQEYETKIGSASKDSKCSVM